MGTLTSRGSIEPQRWEVIAIAWLGAFALAAAGILDGRAATTHWMDTEELARRYPRVRVEPDVLYVDEGRVLTSAGTASGTTCKPRAPSPSANLRNSAPSSALSITTNADAAAGPPACRCSPTAA